MHWVIEAICTRVSALKSPGRAGQLTRAGRGAITEFRSALGRVPDQDKPVTPQQKACQKWIPVVFQWLAGKDRSRLRSRSSPSSDRKPGQTSKRLLIKNIFCLCRETGMASRQFRRRKSRSDTHRYSFWQARQTIPGLSNESLLGLVENRSGNALVDDQNRQGPEWPGLAGIPYRMPENRLVGGGMGVADNARGQAAFGLAVFLQDSRAFEDVAEVMPGMAVLRGDHAGGKIDRVEARFLAWKFSEVGIDQFDPRDRAFCPLIACLPNALAEPCIKMRGRG